MRIHTHPGGVLRAEFMQPLKLSAKAFALALRIPATRIRAIARERRSVTADTALRLARYFGTSVAFWLNLQQGYDLSKVVVEGGEELCVLKLSSAATKSLCVRIVRSTIPNVLPCSMVPERKNCFRISYKVVNSWVNIYSE